MKKTQTVCAVVVTFNRLKLLIQCINSLRNQSYSLDKIIIINNHSSDGTTDWLNSQYDIEVVHQENLGGAGGFHTGVKTALKTNFDWIWLMDDDVEPDKDCLEKMIVSNKCSDIQYDVLQPDRYPSGNISIGWGYGTKINFYNPFIPWSTRPVRAADYPNLNILPIAGFPFEGPLLRSNVLRNVGDVESRFFIIMDDADYSMRVILKGFKIGFVKNAKMCKKLGFNPVGLKNDFKLYYLIRNNIIFDKKYFLLYISFFRNLIAILRVLAVFVKQGIKNDEFDQIYPALKTVIKATIDGVRFKIR